MDHTALIVTITNDEHFSIVNLEEALKLAGYNVTTYTPSIYGYPCVMHISRKNLTDKLYEDVPQ